MSQVWAICHILTKPALSIEALLINLYVFVFLDPLLDQVAVGIQYLIKFTTLLNKQMWLCNYVIL